MQTGGGDKRLGQKNRVSRDRTVALTWATVREHDPGLAEEAGAWAQAFGYDVHER